MTNNELHTENFHLYKLENGMWHLQVYNRNLLRRVNRHLKRYPDDYIFQDGDEGVFTFEEKDLFMVKLALKVRG